MLDTIAIIPAKGFSDGVQNKNLSDIGGGGGSFILAFGKLRAC